MLDLYIHHPELQQELGHISSNNMQIYLEHLELKGYATKTIHDYLGAVLHFSRWLCQKGKTLGEATIDHGVGFIKGHIPDCHCPRCFPRSRHVASAALHRWSNVVGMQTKQTPIPSDIEKLVSGFDDYLANVAGVSVATRLYRRRHVSDFLRTTDVNHLDSLSQSDIANYFHRHTINLAPCSSAAVTDSINQFLQFLFNHNYLAIDYTLHLPRPKIPHNGVTKTALSDGELISFLNAFDRTYPVGKRDYAMARCLSDLGIRTGDVASLKLDDVDWQHSIITLWENKLRRQQKLPMTDTLIEALVDYLCHARPKTDERAIFVYHRAPLGDAVRASTVRGVIRRAFMRANFSAADNQVHRLRYTLATRLLKNGQTIKTIADILGHQCIDTTIRYTVVDDQALTRIALPWPGRIAS